MKTIFLVLAAVCFVGKGFGQKIQPLTIGDTINENVIKLIAAKCNEPSPIHNIEDKLILLDFMNTGCSGCIGALPRMDSLMGIFKNKFIVFVSTPQGLDKVNYFKNHNAIGKKISLPFISKDSALEKYFPHLYISHIVWIYKGKVVAITHSDYVTAKNIRKVLSGAPIQWPVKKDVLNYDYNQTLLIRNPAAIPDFSEPKHTWYTAFTSHLANISPKYTQRYDSATNTTSITVINYTLLKFYQKIFNLPMRFALSRLSIDTSLERFIHKTDINSTRTDWTNSYTFCYETQMEGRPSVEKIKEKMNQDIARQFSITAYIKDTSITCWELLYDSSRQKLPFDKFNYYTTALKNNENSIWGLVYLMNNMLFHVPVINKAVCNLQQYIKVEKVDLTDINAINKMIAPYGFSLKLSQMQMPFLFIHPSKPVFNHSNQNYND